MKTTIKIDAVRSLVVKPAIGGGIELSSVFENVSKTTSILTIEQCGVLLFGLEMALEKQAMVTS